MWIISTVFKLVICGWIVAVTAGTRDDICGTCTCLSVHIFCNGTIDVSLFSKYHGPKITSVVIIGAHEGTLSEENFSNLKDISDLQLEANTFRIKTDAFRFLTKLNYLQLRNNTLKTISSSMFQKNTLIKDLDLSMNYISEINNRVFNNLYHLISLNLSNNSISVIEREAFAGLTALTELDLSGNGLRRLPSGALSYLGALRHLNLCDNLIEELNDGALEGVLSLEELDARNNRLQHIEVHALRPLRSLRVLRLGNNHVATIEVALVALLLERPGLSAQLELNPLRCACDAQQLRDAWEAAAASDLRLQLTCASGQPWDVAIPALACDGTVTEEATSDSEVNRTQMSSENEKYPENISQDDARKSDVLGGSGNGNVSLEFIVLISLISVLAVVTAGVVIILLILHFRVKKTAEEYRQLRSTTTAQT